MVFNSSSLFIYVRPHFTLGVRAGQKRKKIGANFEDFGVSNWPQVSTKCWNIDPPRVANWPQVSNKCWNIDPQGLQIWPQVSNKCWNIDPQGLQIGLPNLMVAFFQPRGQ